jgi:hypothetical protein
MVFDHRTETWRKLNQYANEDISLEKVMKWAVGDRTEWFSDTGRLAEL